MLSNREQPRMVYADAEGQIFDHPSLLMAAKDGPDPVSIEPEQLIELPRGSDLFLLPGRSPVGFDPHTAQPVVFASEVEGAVGAPVTAVAAFLAPAYTLGHHPAFERRADAPALPLFAYGAVGYADGKFVTSGVRVDPDRRQDPWRFDVTRLRGQVERRTAQMEGNRVVEQLRRCALDYGCRAAQNFFIGRHEAPLPTSVTCNAQCVGCISLQPGGEFKASHDRLSTAPTAEEIARTGLSHLERVPDGVVSFGQGCEGEPLLMGDLLVDAVRLMRAGSERGTIHLNSNASKPEVVEAMARAGLDSLRVSLNSPRPDVYAAYYQPRGYGFEDVEASVVAIKKLGGFVSLNYLVFPGVNDTDAEYDALCRFLRRTGVDMIQWRNLNIDPELYVSALPAGTFQPGFGIRTMMRRLEQDVPDLKYGYFNPAVKRVS